MVSPLTGTVRTLLVLVTLFAVACSADASEQESSVGATTTTGPAATISEPVTAAAPAAAAQPAGTLFFEDFVSDASMARFEFDIYHRDDHLVSNNEWFGDHVPTGPNDACTAPEEKRLITRGERSSDFNDDWIYRCAPGGDVAKAHMMTSIGDTSGYSIGAFTPTEVFSDVSEVRWDVNITELGDRQFPEVKIVPAAAFDFQDVPCAVDWLPCQTSTHGQLGSVGTSFFNHTPLINNGNSSADGEQWTKPWMSEGDPALTSIRIRRQHFFRDNGNGTLTLGIEREDGTFYQLTHNGSFPTGPVRVVFADHNYTPDKEETPIGHTWHWDNLLVFD